MTPAFPCFHHGIGEDLVGGMINFFSGTRISPLGLHGTRQVVCSVEGAIIFRILSIILTINLAVILI